MASITLRRKSYAATGDYPTVARRQEHARPNQPMFRDYRPIRPGSITDDFSKAVLTWAAVWELSQEF